MLKTHKTFTTSFSFEWHIELLSKSTPVFSRMCILHALTMKLKNETKNKTLTLSSKTAIKEVCISKNV